MKKSLKILILIFLILFSFQKTLQSQWFKLPNLPVGGTMWDMYFVNANTGWITFLSPTSIIKTTDGGMNWVVQSNINIRQVQFIDSLLGYGNGYVGTNGTIWKTTDGGSDWNSMFLSGNGYADIFFVNKNTGWTCGSDGMWGGVWRTNDGGNSWFRQYTSNTSTLSRIFFLKNKVNGEYWGWTFVVNILWRTTNSGVNWTLINSNIGGNNCQDAYDIYFIDTAKGIITRTQPCFSTTTNSGYNWTHYSDINILSSKIGVGDNNKLWLTSVTDSVIKTTNFFQTYGKQHIPAYALNIFAVDTSTVYAGWDQTHMMKTTNGGGPIIYTEIDSLNLSLPSNYKLYQNYPNPFNPVTKINYELPKDSKVTLIIYDILGKEITRLVDNEFKQAGRYWIDFEEPTLVSGVYFYRIEVEDPTGRTRDFTETKKMIYIK